MRHHIIALLLSSPLLLNAEARWLNTTHDFGAFSEDLVMVDAYFKMVNDGEKPIRFLEARATCGCTVPEFPQGDIAPGDTAVLKVTYNATGRPGQFVKNVYVKTSDAPSVQRTLTISGVVVGASSTIRSRFPADAGKIKLQSSSAGFGEVKRGKLKTLFIGLYNQTTDTLTPVIEGLPPYVSAQITPAAVPPGQQAQMSLTLNSLKVPEWGINSADFLFKADKDSEPLKMDLFTIILEDFDKLTPGQRQNAPQVTVDPLKIDLGEVSTPQTVEFKVENMGKSPLIVRRLQVVDPAIANASLSSYKIKPGKKAALKITIDPEKADNDFINARVSLITNDPENPLTVARITAEITKR